MNSLILLGIGVIGLGIGSVLGYYARQSLVKKRKGTIEAKLEKKAQEAKEKSEEIKNKARQKAREIITAAEKEVSSRRAEMRKAEQMVFKRQKVIEDRDEKFEDRKEQFNKRVEKLERMEQQIRGLKKEAEEELEKISYLSVEQAQEKLLKEVEKNYKKELVDRIEKQEKSGRKILARRAKEIIAQAIQKFALPQARELTTATVRLPSDEIKGRVIGKEGRNIRAFEKLTGVELVVDETPEAVVVSGFDPVRRFVAKTALQALLEDGRIQPTKIEEEVEKAQSKIEDQIQEAGKKAAIDVGVVDLPDRIVSLLGRLYFRSSYGQNVLLHSIEVAHLSTALAGELNCNIEVAKKAGFLHDIGKAVDHKIEGSHVDIGIKILEKFGIEKPVIQAMKSHHEDYPAETLEAIIVKVADQISGARPGARKDNLENYLERLEELEGIATSFPGVEKAYAIEGGREIRVFVTPEEIGDLEAHKLARDIASRIEDELNYPGEIKVNLIRETRVIEYAR